MGNWGKIERRFEYLSRGRRLVRYATNNNKRAWRSAVRMYLDGRKVADGVGVHPTDEMNAQLQTDAADVYRAVVGDVPPGLLRENPGAHGAKSVLPPCRPPPVRGEIPAGLRS